MTENWDTLPEWMKRQVAEYTYVAAYLKERNPELYNKILETRKEVSRP
jgi:hypothetical protein